MRSKPRCSLSIGSRTQNLLQRTACNSLSRLQKIQGLFNDEQQLRKVWIAFGQYISQSLRVGKGVHVPSLGTFTLTPPELTLPGVTNPVQRDRQNRTPVFLLQKDFIRGKDIKSAIVSASSSGLKLHPYSQFAVSGEVPVQKFNNAAVAMMAGMNKDSFTLALGRIVNRIVETISKEGECVIQIPQVGQLYFHRSMCAVDFTACIENSTRNILKQPIDERTHQCHDPYAGLKRHMIQNNYVSQKPLEFLTIDKNTKDFLNKDMGIDLESTMASRNKQLQRKAQSARKESSASNISVTHSKPDPNAFNDNSPKLLSNNLTKTTASKDTRYEQWRAAATNKLREWFIRSKITLKEAFSRLDVDRDGYIGFEDMNYFLLNVTKYNPRDTTAIKVRGLIDQYASAGSGRLDLINLDRLLNQNTKRQHDWAIRCTQDVAMYLIRQFDSLEKGFQSISRNNKKLSISDLKQWIRKSKASNLESCQIDQLLKPLDPSHRGYVFQKEFAEFFGKYSWKTRLAIELLEHLQQKYVTPKEAFQYLSQHQTLDARRFVRKIDEIFKQKYSKEQIEELWFTMAGSDTVIEQSRFLRLVQKDWQHRPRDPKATNVEYWGIEHFSEEERLVLLMAKSRKYLLEQAAAFCRNRDPTQLLEPRIVLRIVKELVQKQENTRFEENLYSKVLGLNSRGINMVRLLQDLKAIAKGYLEHPADRMRRCRA